MIGGSVFRISDVSVSGSFVSDYIGIFDLSGYGIIDRTSTTSNEKMNSDCCQLYPFSSFSLVG